MSDNDLETLEVWLDGELSEEQVESLRRRLSVEPELSQTLDRLRSDRQIRAGIFQAMEPSAAEIETLVANARRGVRKEDLINSRLRALRNVASIAACMAVVFMAGLPLDANVQFLTITATTMPYIGRVVTNIDVGDSIKLLKPATLRVTSEGYGGAYVGDEAGFIDLPGPASVALQRLAACSRRQCRRRAAGLRLVDGASAADLVRPWRCRA